LIKSATAADASGVVTVAGPHCAKPMKSVGAATFYDCLREQTIARPH